MWEALIPAAVNAAATLIGGQQRNDAQMAQADKANAFSAQQFATRYQTTVKDMEAAGLNPMLAYSQGGGSPPSGQQAQISDVLGPSAHAGTSSFMTFKQAELVDAQAKQAQAAADLSSAQAAKVREETPYVAPLADVEISLKNANISLSKEQLGNVTAQTQKIGAEINKLAGDTNFDAQQRILQNTARQIHHLGTLLKSQNATQEQITEVQRATIKKVVNDAKLSGLDIAAAEKMDNLGREYKELGPIISAIISAIRASK